MLSLLKGGYYYYKKMKKRIILESDRKRAKDQLCHDVKKNNVAIKINCRYLHFFSLRIHTPLQISPIKPKTLVLAYVSC